MKRIAIIGGGISGLAAAYTLEQLKMDSSAAIEYVLYESSSRLGGVLRTECVDGCVVEAGPDSFLTEKSWAADFCRALGLGDQLVVSNDESRKTYILVRGRLVGIPDGLMFLVPTKIWPTLMSPLFSWRTKLRMAKELRMPRNWGPDESVASFVERHYGHEMVDRLADPLLSGIYGGSAANLSLRAVLPRFHRMEDSHGSLGRAMLAARQANPHAAGQAPSPIFTSLKQGMQQLADTVVARLPPNSLRTAARVESLKIEGGGWTVYAGAQADHFDTVIVAVPTQIAADLLSASAANLSRELAAIPNSSSITVGLGYGSDVRESLPNGFGFLVPRSEGKKMLATTFVHNKFPHRASADRALLRCFLADSTAESLREFSDEEIAGVVIRELRQILHLRAEPLFVRVYRWKAAMAQYTVGHLERAERIEALRRQVPGLTLAGNGYRGIGVPDCIRSGQEAARLAVAD
jgi:oxygen-dependent protoporphyrinogen oxidase